MERKIDYAILRSFSDKYDLSETPALISLVNKMSPYVRKTIVIVNGKKDAGNTPELLKYQCSNLVHNGQLESVVLQDYDWSVALNEGLRKSPPRRPNTTRLMISTEVSPTPEQLIEMQEQTLRGNGFTTGSYAIFAGRNEDTYSLPRNTFTIWNADAMHGFKFNEQLDAKHGKQGMEDVYMGLALCAKKRLLPSLGPVDAEVSIRAGVNMEEKTRKERETIREYLEQFDSATIKTYFGAINATLISKGRGGIPAFSELLK